MSFGLFLENRSDWRDAQVRVHGMVGYVPWSVRDLSESLRLISLDNG
jgi:hypothetical protein